MLCDAAGWNECATSGTGGNLFLGAQGNDKIWYVEIEGASCGSVVMDPASTGGSDSDTCGSTDWFGEGQLGDCDVYTNVEPAKCEGQQ